MGAIDRMLMAPTDNGAMDEHKKTTPSAREARRALMEQAARYRAARAEKPDAQWNCSRGHAWDDALSAAQNVRCMNCAAQRREMHLRRLREIAEVRGGALLSSTYVDAATPLCWQCASRHVWKARPDAIEREWCRHCVREGVYDALTPVRSEAPLAHIAAKVCSENR